MPPPNRINGHSQSCRYVLGALRLHAEDCHLRARPCDHRSVPIWLLAIIMLGIAFGVPMILGWVS